MGNNKGVILSHQNFVNYYEALNVTPSASTLQLRQAYLLLAKQQHPDKGGSVNTMRLLNHAYTTLKNPLFRKDYDKKYRKHVLGEKITDLSFNSDEDWDLDEVDEFLMQVHLQDRRTAWASPLAVGFAVAGVCLIMFVIVSVSRMTASADSVQTVTSSKVNSH